MAINFDHVTEQITVTDTATNASLTVQPKGTGAFNIAAGSSGINISNGGTVTAITRTATGSGTYTSKPTLAISAPTTAGGVQATATVDSMGVLLGTVQSGGTGYTVGDSLSVVGGTGGPQVFTVATVSGGVVTGITNVSFGSYTVLPTNPVSTTGGTGSGCTLNLGYNIGTTYTITNAGSGYVEQPTVTFSGGGGSGAAAYATVGSGTVVKSIGSTMSFYTPSGETVRLLDGASTGRNYLTLKGGTSSNGGVFIGTDGSDTNVNAVFFTKGTGTQYFATNGGSTNQLVVAHTASAVNYVQVTGAATGNNPTISMQGSDVGIGLTIQSKSANSIVFQNGATQRQLVIDGTKTGINYLQVASAATTLGPVLSSIGSDTNIPLVLQPKGTGALQAQQTDSTATGGNARGANAVDWQTSRSAASQVASGSQCVISGGQSNTSSVSWSAIGGGLQNTASNQIAGVFNGYLNTASGYASSILGGFTNTAAGPWNTIVSGVLNSGTTGSIITTQSATMNGTTAVTLSGSNANIKVGQVITGTYLNSPYTYVAAVSGTSLTLSQAATGSGTATLSFYTPHGVVVGGGNNQATGSYSFIGGGGDAGTAANRNVASGDWSVVVGGQRNVASGAGAAIVGGGTSSATNTASGASSFIGGGGLYGPNTASGPGASVLGGWSNNATGAGTVCVGIGGVANGDYSATLGGAYGNARSIAGNTVFSASNAPMGTVYTNQGALLILARQTTDATPTVLRSDVNAASTVNQVILPNNSAYFFTGEVVSGVTGGGNTKGWTIEGVIKRGANAASTALVGTPTVTSSYADAGASTWTIAVTADTTNGGLAVTFTGQLATTIRTVAKISTTEMTY